VERKYQGQRRECGGGRGIPVAPGGREGGKDIAGTGKEVVPIMPEY
jgi:hypothetical protein